VNAELRRIADDGEAAQAADVLWRAFNWKPDRMQRFIETLDKDRTLAAFVDGRVAAVSRMRPFGMYFGGRPVPMGGFSPVGAAPEFRGQGLATAVTVGQFADLRDRGEVLSALFPASTRLYRGTGFEVAGLWSLLKLPARALRDIPAAGPTAAPARQATKDDIPAIKALYAEVARTRNGHLARPDVWWDRIFEDWDKLHVYVVEGEGYVRYEHQSRAGWGYVVAVDELVATTPEAARTLWRLVASSATQSPDVLLNGPIEHPLLLVLPEQDIALEESLRWMLRLVDAPGAIAARGWPAGVQIDVELDLADVHCDWNRGAWRLIVEDGEGRMERGGSGKVGLAVNGFAALYSGYASPWTLAESGLLTGADEATLAALAAAFAGPMPWMPDFF